MYNVNFEFIKFEIFLNFQQKFWELAVSMLNDFDRRHGYDSKDVIEFESEMPEPPIIAV